MHTTVLGSHRLRATLVVLVALGALLLPAAALASAEPDPAAGSPVASPAASPDASPRTVDPTVVTCVLSDSAVVYGTAVTVSGVVTPAVDGQDIDIVFVAGGDLSFVASTTTDATGAYSVDITPKRNGEVMANVASDGTLSDAHAVTVKPKVTLSHGTPVPFLRLRWVVKVEPASWNGVVTARVTHKGALVAKVGVRCRDGKAVILTPLRGINFFDLSFTLPAVNGLETRKVTSRVEAKWRVLQNGSNNDCVRGMLTAINRLRFRVPSIGTRFNSQTKDAVMAFQKAYRLPRTYVFSGDDWRKLDGAVRIKPRYSTPSTHLEVDKGRQILMVVKGGKVYGVICVSTGATNNTPEGSFHIQQKHPYTTSGYGGILFRTMGFVGNFAIHGYAPVPPYPASHGCVREPMWVADWVYDRSWVGERLYIYH